MGFALSSIEIETTHSEVYTKFFAWEVDKARNKRGVTACCLCLICIIAISVASVFRVLLSYLPLIASRQLTI